MSVDFSETILLAEQQFFQVPAGEQWWIHTRYCELETEPPIGAALRLVTNNLELTGWQPLCAISMLRGEGGLHRRVERLEAAIGADLGIQRVFGRMQNTFTLRAGDVFFPEFRNCLLPVNNLVQNPALVVRGVLHVVGTKTHVGE